RVLLRARPAPASPSVVGPELRDSVLLEGIPVLPPPRAGAGGEAEVVDDGFDSVVVRTRSTAPGWLVLADAWDPGWRAVVDGRPARVLRADFVLRAVRVPPGESRTVFFYRPRGWPWAGFVSLAAWAGGLAFLGMGLRRKTKVPLAS
ncbi:MAG: hypothetical protein KGL53_13830, partial [Elusimicrobia bacterium]|nr:hypothetical protein [Elusimicrobiota bacterium]